MGNPIEVEVQVKGADKAAAEVLKVAAAEQKLLDQMGARAERLRKFGADEATINADPIIKLYEAKLDALAKGGSEAEKKIRGVAGGMEALRSVLGRFPNIAGALGLDDLAIVGYQLERIGGLLAGITATTGAAIGGAAIAAIPIVYDIVKLLEIAKLNRDSIEMSNGALGKGAESIERRLGSRAESGEISREREAEFRARLQALRAAQAAPIAMRDATDAEKAAMVRQSSAGGASGARPDVSNLRVPVETEAEKTRRLLEIERKLNADVEAASGASQATLQAGKLAHAAAMAAIDEAAARGERQTATSTMEAVLRSRTTSQDQQLEALKLWSQAMRDLIDREAKAEASVLDERERQRTANLPLIANDKDALEKNQQEEQAIKDARELLNARTNAQLEQQDADSAARRLNIARTFVQRAEQLQRQQESNDQGRRELTRETYAQGYNFGTGRYLSRDEQVAGLRESGLKALAEVEAAIAKQKELSAGTDGDPLGKVKIEGDLVRLGRERLGIMEELQRLEADNSFVGRMHSNLAALQRDWSNLGARVADFFTNTLGGAVSSLSQATAHSVIYAKDLGQALGNVGLMIEEQILTAIIQLPIQWALSHITMKGISLAWKAFVSFLRGEDVVEANATETAKTPVLAANATLASIGSWGVAVAVGLAAIAGILAATGAFAEGGKVRGPGTGTSDSIMARLSNGENIIKASSSSRLGDQFLSTLNSQAVVDLGALPPGVAVRGARSGERGAGSESGGPGSIQNFHFAFHDDGSSAEKYLTTVKGQRFLVDTARQTVRQVNRKG